MKNATLFHGTGCSPKSYWLPWLKKELEKKKYKVQVPLLPNSDKPDIKEWLPFVLKNGKFSKDTVLIGHSAGCPLILSILENINVKIKQAILVAGFSEPLKTIDKEPILQASYDWKKIKSHVQDLVFINSDNDPWGCNDKAGRRLFDRLGGTLIVMHSQGHFGSDTYKQPYKEFPLLLKLIE